MTSVAEAFVTLRPDTKGFGGEAERNLGAPLKKIAGAAAGAFAAIGVAGLFKDSIEEAREAERVGRQTEAVIKSTGGSAGITAGQIGDLATRLSNLSGIDDEVIQSGENVLLTFTNIRNGVGKGNDIFDQATTAALNMSAALGTDMQGAVIQVGKALNDPIKGVTALQRVGVSFTKSQREQIKALVDSGDTLGAQKIILNELGKEFGGAAEAAADPMQKLSVTVGNLKERVGLALLPVINKLADFLARNLPNALDAAGKAIGPIIDAGKQIVDVLFKGDFTGGPFAEDSDFIVTLFKIRDVFIEDVLPAVQEVVGWLEDHWQVALAAAGGALLLLLSPIAAVVAAVVVAWTQFQTFRDIVSNVVDAVVGFWNRYRDQIMEVLASVGDMFASAFGAVQAIVEKAVAILTDLWDRFGNTLLDKLRIAFEAILQILHGALEVWTGIFDLIKAVLTGKWGEAWDAIKKILSGAWEEITGIIRLAIDEISLIFEAAKAIISAAWSAIWHGIATFVTDIVITPAKAAFDGLVFWITGLPTRIADAAKGMWDGIKNAFKSAINWIIDGWNALEFKIPGFDPPGPGPKFGGFTLGMPDIKPLALGGIVNHPTLALVGERAPEAVIPLDRLASMGGDVNVDVYLDSEKIASHVIKRTGQDNQRQRRRAS